MLPHSTLDAQQGTACDGSIAAVFIHLKLYDRRWELNLQRQCPGATHHSTGMHKLPSCRLTHANCAYCTSINRQDPSYKTERHCWNDRHAAAGQSCESRRTKKKINGNLTGHVIGHVSEQQARLSTRSQDAFVSYPGDKCSCLAIRTL